ncbi:peptidoglycan binding protein CsiV [Shewanella sedimentimangrovi]|uniref:Peptidoglycan binding protein CsiV n=1 Tax=Shewanella sedimentimangrovi TaxID=2814293 RepID=A0ABX7R408_9GAMM|nr:peptidoglycan binding protein CsiV [Shewanella sedimentimangrovi]QSX38567.1 peptidoglycan binding protein CsiV [Shewanella sedimentimangrovi]
MIRHLALSSVLALVPVAQSHAEAWFEVEVLLFERNQASSEVWPEEVTLPSLTKARDLISPLVVQEQAHLAEGMEPCSEAEAALDPLLCEARYTHKTLHYPAQAPLNIAAEAAPEVKDSDGAVLMDAGHSQFAEVMKTLSREPGLKPLLHLTWQQSMGSRYQALPVRLYGGENFSDRYALNGLPLSAIAEEQAPLENLSGTTIDNTAAETTTDNMVDNSLAAQLGAVTDMTADTEGTTTEPQSQALAKSDPEPVWQLDGTLNIYLSHYLYIETDLRLRTPGTRQVPQLSMTVDDVPTTTDMSPQMEQQAFLYAISMVQNRRVRSGEIHYFDHPKLGMVVQIRKMAQPGSQEEVKEELEENDEESIVEEDLPQQ